MRTRSTAATTGVAGLFSLIVALVLLWLFAPTTVGGSFAYVTITGNSMAPVLDTGDMVLLRSSHDYEVGDAIAYRHPQIGTVLHRIVDDDGIRFTLQGDNRSGEDTYRPAREEVIGREWVVVPHGGRIVRELQRPRNLAFLLGSTLLLGVGGVSAGGRERRRRQTVSAGQYPKQELSVFSQTGRQVVLGSAVLAAVAVALLGLYVANGPTREVSEAVPFVERGGFSYGGPVAGGVYDDDQLAAPEPLYRQLVDELAVRFSYELAAGADAALTAIFGTYQLLAEVTADDGWTRTYELQSSTDFTAAHFDTATSLDLSAIEQDLAAVAEITGVASSRHVIRVVARVEAAGQLEGLPFSTEYEHWAQFRLGPLELQFDGSPDTLELAQDRSVSRRATEPRSLGLPLVPVDLGYAQLPLLCAFGLGTAALLLLTVGRASLSTWRLGEAARIGAAYDTLLVEVAEERAAFDSPPRDDVSRFGDLVRLSSAEGLAIMHRAGREDDEYFVTTADRSWRYTVRKPLQDRSPVEVDGRFITTGES